VITGTPGPVWDDVVGQHAAVAALRAAAAHPVHAYLFLGPAGSTKLEAARAFATLLLTGSEDPTTRDARLIGRGEHPDVHEVRRVGAAISRDQAIDIIREASLTPTEGDAKVMILDEFHLVSADGAGRLLKTVEEPPASTTLIILADLLTSDLVTIASRCVRIEFTTIAEDTVAARLVADGVAPADATAAARAAHGDLARARLLAADPTLATRRAAFAAIPHALDGTGAVAIRSAGELLALVDDALAPLEARHATEAAELDEQIRRHGERGSGRKRLEDRHKRELRRYRTDEIRSGLAAMAATYRDAATGGSGVDVDGCAQAVHRIHRALEALDRNANEKLLIESLLWALPDARGT
jgi:DNA polymerase-3 subunit delta'